MYEMNGLRALTSDAVPAGTIHVMRPAPDREDFESRELWEQAYGEWWRTMNLWAVTITNVA